MKKLIQQADFGNVQQISKRWKKQPSPTIKQSISDIAQMLNPKNPQKENTSDSNIQKPHHQKPIQDQFNTSIQQKKRNVLPQVIDQDTEHFKNRLEHLLNTFRTDTVSQFMSMKKEMLECQKDTIKSDTQKYLSMYEQKHQQLLTTKQKLIQVSKQAQKKTIQCQLMSNHICKLNQRLKTTKHLSRPFSIMYQNKQSSKLLCQKLKFASKLSTHNLSLKCFSGWKQQFLTSKQTKQSQATQNHISSQVSQIVGKFQKQMDMLREQLNQAHKRNQQYQNNKYAVQENLKKAFLRGMSMMNMEAMGVLNQENNLTMHNMSMNSMSMNNMPINNMSMHNMPINNVSMHNTPINNTNMHSNTHFPNQLNAEMNSAQRTYVDRSVTNGNTLGISALQMASQKNLNQSAINNNNTSVIMGKIKTQSKEHRWKQAPIMGVEQNEQYEQPRPILVKPSTQGKVIKIVDGKSATVDSSKKKPIISQSNIKQTNNNIIKSSLNGSRKNL